MRAFVAGTPVPQGSKRYLGRGIMADDSKYLKAWRADIRAACLDSEGRPQQRFDGAVSLILEFIMPRPASAPKKRTPHATKRPDIDKLMRAVCDAITSAHVWKDDSQVVWASISKRIAGLDEVPGCMIVVTEYVEGEG